MVRKACEKCMYLPWLFWWLGADCVLKKWYEDIEAASGDIKWIAYSDGDETAEHSCDEIDYIFVGDEVVVFAHAAVYFTITILSVII